MSGEAREKTMTVVRSQWSVIGISVVYLAVGALLSALCVPAEAQQPGKIPLGRVNPFRFGVWFESRLAALNDAKGFSD